MDMTRPPAIAEVAPADFASHVEGLTDVLHACVHAGASVNFILPFPRDEARAFWSRYGLGPR